MYISILYTMYMLIYVLCYYVYSFYSLYLSYTPFHICTPLGTPQKIGQYALIGVLLLTRARFFLQVHAVAYLISKVNYEFAKAQGLF